jgi:hypothetical protein
MKKALKINVENQTITEVFIGNEIDCISNEIGNGCKYFCCPYEFPNNDAIYSDDDILLRNDDIKGGFMFRDWHYPIVNNAIILGTDEEGDSIDCKTSIEDLHNIIFLDEISCKDYSTNILSKTPYVLTPNL